jgi:DHA2 family multidrug resistance protein
MGAWLIIGVLALGSIATMTAATIVNVALPSVIGALGLGQDEAQWLSTAFLASSTGFMLFNTWALARWGMRASFVLAMVMFVTGSVLGAAAQELSLLVLGRVMQGAGAGLIQPMAMVVIYTRFPVGVRGLAVGIYSLCVIVSPAFGPVVGGALIDAHDWRIVFVATVPLAVLAAPLGWRLLPARDLDAERMTLDWTGLALVMAALALVLQGLAHGSREGWDDPGTQLRLAGAAVAAMAFVVWEARHRQPVLNLRLFARPGFCAAGAAIFVTGAAVYGSTWLAPLFVQQVQHYSPSGAGDILLPAGLAMAVCFPLAGRLSDQVDTRVLLVAGAAMFAGSMMMLADVGMQTEFGAIATALALGRAGIGVIMPAANASAMRHASGMLASAAPAATFLSQTGGALGVALLSALLGQRTAFHGDALAPLVNFGVMDGNVAIEEASRAVWSAALMLSFRDCFMVTGLIALLLVPVGLMAGDRSNFTDRLKRALTLFR